MSWGNAIQRKIIFLPLCAVLFVGWRPAYAQAAPSVLPAHITPLENGVELADGSSLLDVEVLENRLVGVHVRVDGNTTPRTLVVGPHPVLHKPTAVARSSRNGVYTLSAPGITVRIQEARPHRITFLNATGRELLRSEDPIGEARDSGVTMQHAADDTLYGIHGLGIKDTAVSFTRNDGGKAAAGYQGNSGAPFVFSVRYGLLVDSDGGEFTTGAGSLAFRHSSRPDVEYFVFAGAPLETMAALSRVVGPPPLPPEWTLGFLNSQWGSTQDEVESIVAEYRNEDLPIDGFVLDFDWKAWGEDNYGEWRWNSTSGAGNVSPDKFPGGASGDFAKAMTAEGIKLSGILKPRILTTVYGDPNQPTQAAAYATDHHFWYPGEAPFKDYFSHRLARDLDFNNPDERAWFWQHLMPAFHAGLVGWWNDEADANEDFTMEFNNFQFMNMGRALYEGQRADSNLRVWSINRNFYLGASRYGYALWSGDIQTGFASMAFQAQRMLAALDTGESHWSMDTGGFIGHPSAENYARWMEFAAFVPIMRVHGTFDEKRQPWVYGPVAEAAGERRSGSALSTASVHLFIRAPQFRGRGWPGAPAVLGVSVGPRSGWAEFGMDVRRRAPRCSGFDRRRNFADHLLACWRMVRLCHRPEISRLTGRSDCCGCDDLERHPALRPQRFHSGHAATGAICGAAQGGGNHSRHFSFQVYRRIHGLRRRRRDLRLRERRLPAAGNHGAANWQRGPSKDRCRNGQLRRPAGNLLAQNSCCGRASYS